MRALSLVQAIVRCAVGGQGGLSSSSQCLRRVKEISLKVSGSAPQMLGARGIRVAVRCGSFTDGQSFRLLQPGHQVHP